MIDTTYSGTPVFLISSPPEWANNVDAVFSLKSTIERGKTNREEREPLVTKTICELSYGTVLNGEETTALRAAIDTWDNRPILCPFWPSMRLIGESASIIGGLKVWFEPEFTDWEIGTGSAPSGFTPSAQCLEAPVLWGRFVDFPEITTISGSDDSRVSFEFIENGDPSFALAPDASTLTTQVVNTVTVPKLTVSPHWRSNSTRGAVRIERGSIGWNRAESEEFHAQSVRSRFNIQFILMTTDELLELVGIFTNRGGSVGAFMAPEPKGSTFSLCRFSNDSLSIRWTKPAYGGSETASCSVEVISVPTETVSLSGETPGVSIGGKPGRWFGYLVTNGIETWRFTSHDTDITGPGSAVFSTAQINHSNITEELNLKISDCTINVENYAGSPWGRLRNTPNALPLTVSIFEGLVSDALNASTIYTGEAMAPKTSGNKWKIKLRGPGFVLDVKGPRQVHQTTCTATFGDSRCSKDLSSIQVTKTLTAFTGDVATFTGNGFPDGRFRNGYAKRTIGGATQRYLIVESSDSGGNLTCVFANPISPAITGAESGWVLTPGCDGSVSSCVGFSNFVNFRGSPHAPKTNPAITPIEQGQQGKK